MAGEQIQRQTSLTSGIPLLVLVLLTGRLSAVTARTAAEATHLKETYFHRVAVDDVLFTESLLMELPSLSPIECSKQCAQSEGCVMATFYHSGGRPGSKCRLFGKVTTGLAGNWLNASGAVTFAVSGGDADVTCLTCYELQCGRYLAAVNVYINYSDAQQRCSQMGGGRLPMTKTLEDMECLREFIVRKGLGFPYVGADDRKVPGQFQWNDGTPLPEASPLWASSAGDPVHRVPGSDCVFFYKKHTKLRTIICSKKGSGLVCEKDGM